MKSDDEDRIDGDDGPEVYVGSHRLTGAYEFEAYPRDATSKTQRKKRRFLWGKVNMPEVFRKTGIRTVVNRLFSRGSHDYHEHIVDQRTGRTRRNVVERLADHKARGSARKMSPDEPPSTDD